MKRPRRWFLSVGALVAFGLIAPTVRADLFRNIAYGLGYAGFDIEGSRNHLSGGTDFSISRNLVGNKLDFGAWDLTLQGPVSFEVSTGGRYLSQFDISLSTALTGDVDATPLGYLLNYDVGGQSTEINGTLLLDAGLSLNGFGFYDIELTYSSRQDVSRDGRFANDELAYDSDIGPISISGNIVADALALVTQPFFDAAGYANPFLSFSGAGSLSDLLTDSTNATLKALAAGIDPVESDRSALLAFLPLETRMIGPSPQSAAVEHARVSPVASEGSTVPEPATLVLLLCGIPAIAGLRRCARIPT